MNLSRQFVSAFANPPALRELEARMAAFYRRGARYYADIADTASRWRDDPEYRAVQTWIAAAARPLELGCGEAFILAEHPELEERYRGVDFSPELLEANRGRHPRAEFILLGDDGKVPLADGSCDAVFALWVLEHTVRPQAFLDECLRLLAPGGRLALLTPDLLGPDGLGSLRYGLPNVAYGPVDGDWRQNLRARGLWAALRTFHRAHHRVPALVRRLRNEAEAGRGFLINLEPLCFEDGRAFRPDVDAVYMTYEPEIRHRLANAGCLVEPPFAAATARKHLLIRATKF